MARGKKSGTQATSTADPVTIQYNGNTISQFTDKGSVKLKCADKRMLSDVEINYGVENYAPSAVTSTGDVTITYGEETIGTLSDSGTLTLSTGMKRVEHDIGIVYAKPATPAGANYVPVTIQNSLNKDLVFSLGAPIQIRDENLVLFNNATAKSFIGIIPNPASSPIAASYRIAFKIASDTDSLAVVVNGDLVEFNTDGYYLQTRENW